MIKVLLVFLAVLAFATKDATDGMQRRLLSTKNLGQCLDSSFGHCDSYGDCCPEYQSNKHWCGHFDTKDFDSKKMCCACGGGKKKAGAYKLMSGKADVQYNRSYWANKCKEVPSSASTITVKMGKVTDHFKPLPGKSMCDMLTSDKHHEWAEGKNPNLWRKVKEYHNDHLGGAAIWGLSSDVQTQIRNGGDTRTYLSFWGNEHHGYKGGCCNYGYTDADTSWGKSFTMYYNI